MVKMNVEDVDGKENKREKGVNKNAVKNTEHEDYIEFLFNKKVTRHNMKRIPSKLHRSGTCDVCKIPLPCFDNKRYLFDDGINTLGYSHKDKILKSIALGKVNRINEIKQSIESSR